MWKRWIPDRRANNFDYRIDDFKALLRYIDDLASHKMGYPVSLLTYLGIVNNQILGIKSGSIANILLNNVGDPFKDSETSLLEVKKHEREIIAILEKYYGLPKGGARGYVTTGGTEGNFAGLWWSKRFLINNALDLLIKTDDEIKLLMKDEQELIADLKKVSLKDYQIRVQSLQKLLGIKDTINKKKNMVQEILTPTIFYSKNHTHYSIPKISEILRLNIRSVEANVDGSIDLKQFKKAILFHTKAHPLSPIIVIANIGTTITGAIDDVPAIKKILDEFMPPLNFTIHMDGALTGFVMPILKPFGEINDYFTTLGANTLAVSAHKYPGLSQPCGIILARKEFFEKAFEKSERSIDYVGNIVDVTITGSRSGLNVLMFYNALCALGLNKNTEKLKFMIQENLTNARYLRNELVKLYGEDKVSHLFHFNVNFPKPSQQIAKKYQLMLTGEKATICVLTNVTRSLIDQFIMELKLDIQKEKVMTHSTTTTYTIQTLGNEHVKQVLDLFVKSFCDSEPITKHLNIHYQDYEPFATEVLQKAVKEGMSKVAVDKQGKVIAFAIAEDLADPFIPHIAHYPKIKPVLGLLSELTSSFTKGRKFIKGKIVHIWIVAVEPTYRGYGLSTEIDLACVEDAARKGYDFAYAEFTNQISENVTHQFRILKLFNKINYDDFKLDGEYPFKGVKGTATSYVAAIRPGINFDALSSCYKQEEKI